MADSELIQQVAATTGLSPAEAARVVDDVLAFYGETVEEFVRRRHGQMQTYGARNAEIFATLAAEIRQRRVAAPELSERQLRRMIYG
ncbi:hypothetical protein [Luteipulveratus mongoliensis]|uniref:DNA-binding protein n=1 Tax=Luteipulveratus mongoliensis TaxID=571913 RepID=A0A0K1JF87_9MICO|nr:hypothetical protein [Luteipulveratus mongoliensis]AKU15250.1 hypothetical protein VV02_04210 [Luteipulveratus mongoliensis]